MGNAFDPSGTADATGVLYKPVAKPNDATLAALPRLLIEVAFDGEAAEVEVPPDPQDVTQLMWRLYLACGEATIYSFWDRLKKRQGELTKELVTTFRGLDRSQGTADESEAMKARVRAAISHARAGWAEIVQAETIFLAQYEATLLPYALAKLEDRKKDIERWWAKDYEVKTAADPSTAVSLSAATSLDARKLKLDPADPEWKSNLIADTVKLAALWKQYAAIVQYTLPELKKRAGKRGWSQLVRKYETELRVRKAAFELFATELEGRHPVALLAFRALAKRATSAPGGAVAGYTAEPRLQMPNGEQSPERAAEEEIISAMARAWQGTTDAKENFKKLRLFNDGRLPASNIAGRELPLSGAEQVGKMLADKWDGHGAVWVQHPMHIQLDADLAALTAAKKPETGALTPGTMTTKMTAEFLETLGAAQIKFLQRTAVPGSIANRARKEVFRHVEALIKARKALIEDIATVTAVAGLLLALPTDGASIYVAGAIDLALAGYEGAIEVRDYLDDAALGALAISAAERMYWVAPELSVLAGKLAELVVRAASDLPLVGVPAKIIDAAAVVAFVGTAVK